MTWAASHFFAGIPFPAHSDQIMEIIRSRQNPLVKACIKLASQRRERLKAGLTLLDGPHLVAAAMDAKRPPEQLLVAESALAKAEVNALIVRYGKAVAVLDDALFAELSELESISGLLAIWQIPSSPMPCQRGFVLALDGIQDPGNVGAMLRTAAAVGVKEIWLGLGSADAWSPKVLRAGMGAHFALPVIERVDLPSALGCFQGERAITVLDEGSRSLFDTDLRGDIVFVLGNEGRGVSADVAAVASLRIHIPMCPGMESLNVGAAAAICLYERYRQSGCGSASGVPVA